MDAAHALDDLTYEAIEIDDFEGETIGLELAARHVAEDVAAAFELLDRGPEIVVLREVVGPTDPGQP